LAFSADSRRPAALIAAVVVKATAARVTIEYGVGSDGGRVRERRTVSLQKISPCEMPARELGEA